jgi:D-glycero-D-manno-heptose 1,7-bisphosphate phosphatase
MQSAIFLDRDGVIIRNRHTYIRSLGQISFYRSSLSALAKLSRLPTRLIIVTNQSAIGRGLLSPEDAERINRFIMDKIESCGGRIDGLFMCPHHPQIACDCRKPAPGLLQQAAHDLDIDLRESVMIGDALSDLQAGQNAGVRQTILLLTGRGLAQSRMPGASSLKPFLTYRSLAHAASHVKVWWGR